MRTKFSVEECRQPGALYLLMCRVSSSRQASAHRRCPAAVVSAVRIAHDTIECQAQETIRSLTERILVLNPDSSEVLISHIKVGFACMLSLTAWHYLHARIPAPVQYHIRQIQHRWPPLSCVYSRVPGRNCKLWSQLRKMCMSSQALFRVAFRPSRSCL